MQQLADPIIAAVVVFALVFVLLSGVEKVIHKLTRNPDQSYKIGIWVFSSLAALYTVFDLFGRR